MFVSVTHVLGWFRLVALKSVAEVFKKLFASIFQTSTTTLFTVSTFPDWIFYSYHDAPLFQGPAFIYNSNSSLFTLFKAEDVRKIPTCQKHKSVP